MGETETEMKMNEHDRLMAITRHPEYGKDYKAIIELLCKVDETDLQTTIQKVEALERRLCQKWELENPIPPFPFSKDRDWQIVFKATERKAIVELTEDEWPNRLFEICQNATGKCRFVRLKIDLTRSKRELLKAFSDNIKSWTKDTSKDKKSRYTKYNPWDIYDLIQGGLNLLEIARSFHGKDYPRGKRTPAYSEELWPPYKRVKRAYDRALEMIKAVKPLYPVPIKLLVDV